MKHKKHHKNEKSEKKSFTKPPRAGAQPKKSKPLAEHPKFTGAKPDLYGHHACAAAWLNPARKIKALYLCDSAAQSFDPILHEAKKRGLTRPAPAMIDKGALERILPPGAVHQGVALAAEALSESDAGELLIEAGQREKSLLLILDQVTDLHNIGAILRSACAFGAHGMIVQRKHAPSFDGGVLAKTACGALEHVKIAQETNLSRAIEELQEGGFFVIGLDERGELEIGAFAAQAKAQNQTKIALVLGAEGPGLRRLVAEKCDALVRLPMHGAMPSINVSNAAAVALYALSEKIGV